MSTDDPEAERDTPLITPDDTAGRIAEAGRAQTEERLRLLIDSAKDFAIFGTGVEGQIDYWSTGAERIFGWTEAEALGQHVRLVFTPEDRVRGAAEEEMRTAATAGRAADERWHVTKAGTRFYASGVLTPIRSAGTLRGFVKVARDLTQSKILEDAARRAHDDLERTVLERTRSLEEANRALQLELQERLAAEHRLRSALDRLTSAQEDERKRIARDIHDHLGQQITALRLAITAATHALTEAGQSQVLERSYRLATELDQSIDTLAWELRPQALEHLGLSDALGRLVGEWSARSGVPANYQAPATLPHLLPHVESNLYRIAQESLHNIYKHAGATRVEVMLERSNGTVLLVIEDDGRGFEVPDQLGDSHHGGLGLLGMQERASLIGGRLAIESQAEVGTTVHIRVPASPPDDERRTTAARP